MKSTMKIQKKNKNKKKKMLSKKKKKKKKMLSKKKPLNMKPTQPYVDPTGLGHQTQDIYTWQPATPVL